MAKTLPYTVTLKSCGNIDFGQNPNQSLPGVPVKRRKVASLSDASVVTLQYIAEYDLGGGNWVGGQVMKGKEQVAWISYNGRIWDMQGREIVP